jgi:radical SAM-linked protein
VRVRIRSTKVGKVRFVSHRDTARLWERALRRAGLDVATSAGFTPRPRISFGLALPTGAESLAEYVDVELRGDVDVDRLDPTELPAALSGVLPDGIDVVVAAECVAGSASLQDAVTSCTWELWSGDHVSAADVERARTLLAAGELPLERERKGVRTIDDVRPALLDLRPGDDARRLVADLATTGRALRPAELATLAFPHVDPLDVRALRTHQWIGHDGDRREVLSLPAGVTALAEAASA